MKSAKYWEKAALQREIAVQEEATATAEEVLELYDGALDDINTEIQKIKYNFRKRYGLDEKTAEMFLTQAQREENLNSLVYALEHAPDEDARDAILDYIRRDGLSVRAYASRIERYDAVKQSIFARVKRLAVDETALVAAMAKKAYSVSYYSVMDDTAKGLDVGINFGILNDRAISEAVDVKWSGKRFSKRIWDNTDKLADEAQKLVTKSIMSGESWSKTAEKLADRFEVEKFRAATLVHTEAAHAHNAADLKAYEDLDIEEYKYLATLDYRTCETCQPLDGMVFRVSDAQEGVNFPVMHPRCRCTTTINMNYTQRRARNPETGKNELIDGDVTYKEWKENLTPEQKQALELTKKKDDRRIADKRQYAEYKHVLGEENVPKTFASFRSIKENHPDRFNELRAMYREKNVDKSDGSGIISLGGDKVKEFTELGKIKMGLFEKEFGRLRTDEIIITKERVEHIKSHHPEDYELFYKYGADTVKNPDEIIRDMKNEGTVFMIKHLEDTNLNVVSRLVLQTDDEKLKNSVMTFYRIRQKNLVKLEKKNKILYKKE